MFLVGVGSPQNNTRTEGETMAATYGRVKGIRGEASRLGDKYIFTSAETWRGAVRVWVLADGTFEIEIGPKDRGSGSDNVGGTIHLIGNVGDNGRNCYLRKSAIDKIAKPTPVQCIKRSRRVKP